MPTLLLRFPGRRYHATPWGHHVNEGLIEWPPSPWRVLRALLSVGYTALGWPAAMAEPWSSAPPPLARRLLERLADVAPRYALPAATGAHTRHYMPTAEFKNGQERTTMVFDTWAQVEGGELAITWDVDLDAEALALLAELASRLNYLGRSESWVQARLASPAEAQALAHNCWPCEQAPPPGPGWEQVALLAPQQPPRYEAWRAAALAQQLATLPPLPPHPAGKKPPGKAALKLQAEREARMAPFPQDTMACLQVDTSFLREHGWSQPPGTHKLLYWRRSDALQASGSARVGAAGRQASPVRAVLLALASQSANSHALPTTARTLPQAEMLHRQVLGAFGKIGPLAHSRVLSGCDGEGRPLRGAHGHAHVLPLDLDADGHLDHILVWAPDGLASQEQHALRQVRSTYTKGGIGAMRLAWVGAGELSELGSLPAPRGAVLLRTCAPARHWVTATPFVPPRHVKPRGANSLAGQIAAELASRGLPAPTDVQWLDPREHELARQLRHTVRSRRFGPPPPADHSFALRLSFAEPVQGPLCLGYGSHFGLGRFEQLATA
jgi:CRISPR-associated protein Csb2